MNWLMRARARVRARLAEGDSESGFALIYVLAVTTMVALMVASTLVVTTGAVVPAVHNAYDQAADAAAQSGLQDFVTHVDSWCGDPTTSSVPTCTLHFNIFGPQSISLSNSDGSYTAQYSWKAVTDPSNRYFRVRSVGTVQEGGISATKVVFGDVAPGGSLDLLNYGMVSAFETQSSSTVLTDWPERTIALDPAAQDAADVPIKGGKIHWSGSSPGTAAGKVAVCNATFDAKGGRGNNPPPSAPNPYVDYTESGLNGNNYSNYQPCHTSWGHGTELLAPADRNSPQPGGYYSNDSLLLSNSFPGGTGPLFDQPVTTSWQYTTDDANTCGTAQGQNYRSFSLICGGLTYNVEVGGSPAPNSTYPDVQYRPEGPAIPTGVDYASVPNSQTCAYVGPTRVVLNGDGTAVVTSPQTTSTFAASSPNPGQCYVGAGPQGMAQQTVDLSGIALVRAENNGDVPTTTPAVAHGTSGWPTTGQQLGDTPSTSNSVFYLTNGTSGTTTGAPTYAVTANDAYVPATGDNPSTKSDGAWNPQWTSYSGGGSCGASTLLTDLRFLNCYVPEGTYSNAYSWLKAQVQAAIAANPSNYATSATLQNLVKSFVTQGNSSDANNSTPTQADYTSHRWVVSAGSSTIGSCTPLPGVAGPTTDTPVNPPSSDPFYQGTAGDVHTATSTDTSCVNVGVTLQIGTCNSALSNGVCPTGNYVWGNGTAKTGGGQSVAQFQMTFTVKTTTITTTTTPGVSSFPDMSDVTQYQMGFDSTGNGNTDTFGTNGPGDLYVEGSAGHTMALVGDDDVIITGYTGPVGTNPANPSKTADNRDPACAGDTGNPCPVTPALEIVGRNTVRVYHPVKCANAFNLPTSTFQSEIAATDPGFCPNDISGLYTSLLPDNARPSQQYANLRGDDLDGLTIHAAMFALGDSDAHITCPQPPNGGGTCGGEFTVDNFNRGNALGYVTEIGTLGMAHHAPVGEEWEIADATGATSRPYSGYQLAQQYQDLRAPLADAGLDQLINLNGSYSLLWHIVSVSTGTTS